MYIEKNVNNNFLELIIHIENYKFIQMCAKFKEERIISFRVIMYERFKNIVLRKTRLNFQKAKTQWSSSLTG